MKADAAHTASEVPTRFADNSPIYQRALIEHSPQLGARSQAHLESRFRLDLGNYPYPGTERVRTEQSRSELAA